MYVEERNIYDVIKKQKVEREIVYINHCCMNSITNNIPYQNKWNKNHHQRN